MPKKSTEGSRPFDVIDTMYQRYIGELTPAIKFLLRGFVLILISIAGGALLLGLGIFAF